MSKWASTAVLDALLDKVATGTILNVCSAQPTTREEAVSTYSLAEVALTSGDFTKSAGSPSGRKITVAEKDNITVDASGTVTHVAISDATNLLYVTTVAAQALTAGNTVKVPIWNITIADAS